MWLGLLGLLGQLPGIIGQSFQKYYDYKAAVLAAQTAQAQALVTANLEKETALLGVTSSGFKQMTFVLWYCPFMLAMIAPNYAKVVFANLSVLPEWYLQTAITLLLAVWGIQTAATTIAGIFTGITSFMDARKTLPANMFYKVLHSVKGNLSQVEVDLYNRALDEVNKDK